MTEPAPWSATPSSVDPTRELPTEEIGPYGVSVADVGALVPELTIVEERDVNRLDKSLTDDRVAQWITDLSAQTQMRVFDLGRVPAGEHRDLLLAGVKTAVACGVASYAEAAMFPERTGKTDTSYASVLWDRYVSGMTLVLDTLPTVLDGSAGNGTGPAAWYFPPPMSGDRRMF